MQLVVEEDRLKAEQIVQALVTGSRNIEETLRVRAQLKTIRLKAVALYDEVGKPVRMLGVDLDISEL